MLRLAWVKRRGEVWRRLNKLDLTKVSGDGVYLIRCDDLWIYVGQGSIRDRFKFHQTNEDVQSYSKLGTLYVAWAKVPSKKKRYGVEKYLADKLLPLEGGRHPDVDPIKVNLPT